MNKETTNLVKPSTKAKKYYIFNINGTDYIRPISMKFHDGFNIISDEEKKRSNAIQEYSKLSELFFEDLMLFEENPKHYNGSTTTDMLHKNWDIYNTFLKGQYDTNFELSDINKMDMVYKEKAEEEYKDKFIMHIIWDFLCIGSLLKTKSIEEIEKFDKWEEAEKKTLRRKVLSFVNDYGLLNVLGEVFFGLRNYDSFLDVDYLIDKIPVTTFIGKIIDGYSNLFLALSREPHPSHPIKEARIKKPFIFSEKGKGVRNHLILTEIGDNKLIKGTMPLLDYIKVFFPTYTFMYHVDEYIQMDYRYLTQYRVNLFIFFY